MNETIFHRKGDQNQRQHNAEDSSGIKSFVDNQQKEEAYDERHLGVQAVPLDKIVGSVGRYKDFNQQYFQSKYWQVMKSKRFLK